MIEVFVSKQSSYPIKTPRIKKAVRDYLKSKGLASDAVVSVALIGKSKMLELCKKYLKDSSLHNVLSFTEREVGKKFIFPPNTVIHLGEVVVCFPVAVEEAKKEQKLIESKTLELVLHGLDHLLGYHHEEHQ